MNNLLILCQSQFGYHIDTFYYCKNLYKKTNITYICWDYGKPRYVLEGVNVIYLQRKGSGIFRLLNFILASISLINKIKPEVVFVKYFPFCSIVQFLLKDRIKTNLDIRTGSVNTNRCKNFFEDFILCVEARLFKNVTVISKSLQKKWFVPKYSFILPLGAEIANVKESEQMSSIKNKCEFNILYVGSLIGRQLDKTIIGVEYFKIKNPEVKINYFIAGEHMNPEGIHLKNLVAEKNLDENIKFLGYINRESLLEIFKITDFGVVHVPLEKYYDCQPSTKLFEFLLSGIPVIATSTSENSSMLNSKVGVLYDSTPNGFSNALENSIYSLKLNKFSVKPDEYKRFSWCAISDSLYDFLNRIR